MLQDHKTQKPQAGLTTFYQSRETPLNASSALLALLGEFRKPGLNVRKRPFAGLTYLKRTPQDDVDIRIASKWVERVNMKIRKPTAAEQQDIKELYFDAFDEQERQQVADLACALLTHPIDQETLHLVASNGSSSLGHVAFSPVWSIDETKQPIGTILSPLAVASRHQRQGIGSLLIREGLRQQKEQRVRVVFVYGDPNYYGRFGFATGLAAAFPPPFPLQFEFGWQALALVDKKQLPESTPIRCVAPLNRAELW